MIPPTCVPDSCIVNIYDEGDCIPPHIDNHDFVRPFCTVSFLSECNIVFGTNLSIVGPGQFSGPIAIPLPVGYENPNPHFHLRRLSIAFDSNLTVFHFLPGLFLC